MKKGFLNKIILMVALTLSVAATWLYANPVDVATDSGFDSSYSGGGGGGGGGGGSSSGSYGSSSDGSSGTGEMSPFTFIVAILYFIVITYLIISTHIGEKNDKNRTYYIELNKDKSIPEAQFRSYIKNETMEQFILNRYQDYLAVQYAWMEFKYDMLSNKTTNELYNQYQMQLETLKVKGQKNVMKDFLYVDGMITNISKINNRTVVTVEIITRFYDYIINENSKVIIRGTDSKKISMHYQMKFIKDDKKKTPVHCPNCGAELKKTSTNVCEFCRTKITKETEDWLLSEKKAISQQ
jgi:preprotein translocase subunit SecG/DNA-directed RNA polymerase subunit RPC12/RpoP